METYKDSVYPCKAGGTPANIDGDEGQEHHRAPGTGSILIIHLLEKKQC